MGITLNKDHKQLAMSIYLITVCCIFLTGLKLNGVGASKLLVASLMIASFFIVFRYYLKTVKQATLHYSGFYNVALIAILIYGLITVLRSFTLSSELFTLFGNPYMGFAWLTPIVFVYGVSPQNLLVLNRVSIVLIKVSLVVSPLLYLANKNLGISSMNWFSCLYFVPFFTWRYQTKKDKIWTVIGVVVYLLFSRLGELRTGFVQVLMHAMAFGLIAILSFFKRGKVGNVKAFFLILLAIAVFFSVLLKFDDIVSKLDNSDKTDTRSFLYLEVFEDLKVHDQFVFGKGALGKYYSDYFFNLLKSGETNGDYYQRITVEVGFLEMLYKGGWVMVFLFYALTIPATLQAIFFSKSIMAKGIGIYCLIYLIITFILNVPIYCNTYIYFWILIGFCASKRFRDMDERHLAI